MSKQQVSVLSLTFKASGAVAAYRAVGFSGAQATVQGQKILGVSPRPTADGELSDAVVCGTAVIECGGNFAVGDSLIVDSAGRAIKVTGSLAVKSGATAMTSSAANGATVLQGGDLPEFVFADALEAGGMGGFAEVLLRR